MPQRTFISKEEKQAPGFKVGRARLTLLFCTNAAGLMIRTALISKVATTWSLKGKDKHQLPVIGLYNKKSLDNENQFPKLVPLMLCPYSRKYLASKGLLFKVLLILILVKFWTLDPVDRTANATHTTHAKCILHSSSLCITMSWVTVWQVVIWVVEPQGDMSNCKNVWEIRSFPLMDGGCLHPYQDS